MWSSTLSRSEQIRARACSTSSNGRATPRTTILGNLPRISTPPWYARSLFVRLCAMLARHCASGAATGACLCSRSAGLRLVCAQIAHFEQTQAASASKQPKSPAAAEKRTAAAAQLGCGAAGAAAGGDEAEKVLQRITISQLVKGGKDWDLQEEPCHNCRHPCFYTMLVSSHMDAAQPPAAQEDETAEETAAREAAAPIPLVSCLSPQCLGCLPGRIDQLTMYEFYTDAGLQAALQVRNARIEHVGKSQSCMFSKNTSQGSEDGAPLDEEDSEAAGENLYHQPCMTVIWHTITIST